MKLLRRVDLVSLLVLAVAACTPPGESDPGATENGGTTGSDSGGSTGSGGKGGKGGGSGGSGGVAAGGAGGDVVPQGGKGGGNANPDAMGDAAKVDVAVKMDMGTTTTPDMGVKPGKCDYAPKANATQIKLKFEPITLMGVPVGDTAKGGGSKDGIGEIKWVPGKANEFLLLQKRGRVSHMKLDDAGKTATLIKSYDLEMVNITQDFGLISVAFDPDFATNKLIYFGHCSSSTPKTSRVSRYTWDAAAGALSDRVDIITWTGGGGPAWHSMGSVGFDPEGNLWVVHGEMTTAAQAQNMSTNLGKLLRIVPSRTPGMGGYMPAAGNPYFNDPKPKSAIYAAGFRSPWRAFLNANGQYFVGDVGDTTNEEVNVVTEKGQNFGWGGCTGGGCIPAVTSWRGANDPYDGDGNPVKEARRGRVVWVGTQYGDCGNDRYNGALTGVHLFGDFFAGWFRGMVLDGAGKKMKDTNLADLGGVSSAAQAPDGYIYVTTFGPYDSATTEKPGLFRALPQ